MSEYLKVENNNQLIRDVKSSAIINTDTASYNNYLRMTEKRKQHDDNFKDVVKQIGSLKEEMFELKKLILKLTDNQ